MTKKILFPVFLSVFALSILFISTSTALAGSATLSWNANTESDLAGYKIYYGASPRTGTDPKICGMCGYSASTTVSGAITTYTFNNLTDGLTYYFSVSARDTSNNESSFSAEVNKVISAIDTTAPTRTNGLPSGTLSANTTQATLSLTTNENATCRYSTTVNTAYGSMTGSFTTTGGTTHSRILSGLSSGQSYNYYVRCQDYSSNANTTDYQISFSVASTSTASSTTVTFQPTADTNINIDAYIYATSATLDIYTWPTNRIANAILMKFNLSSIPASSTIQSANLYLNLVETDSLDTATSTYAVSLHKIINKNPNISLATGYTYDGVNNWTANTCCYNNIPLAQADIGSAVDTKNIDKTLGYKSWDMTSLIQDWMNNPSTNYGLLLNSDSSKSSDRYRYFASMENINTNARPYLTITYSLASSAIPSDTTSPSAITNLSASNIAQTSVNLSWTATGDDGNYGTASSYDIRYSTSNITSSNWNSATQVSGEPTPLSAGSVQSFSVVGLSPNTQYYFAIIATDDAGNISNLSNIASARTQSLTLSVSLSASPNFGIAPLNNISLSASVSGSAQGTTNYTFYCNRSDSGTNITTPYNYKLDNSTSASLTASNICSYQNSGTYTAKVIVEIGTMVFENRATIIVSVPTPAPTPISAPPTSGGSGGGGGGGGGGGNYSDTTPPSAPLSFSAAPYNKQVVLLWKNPTDSDFVRVLILRKEGSQPTSRTDGTYIYEGTAENFADKKVENNKTYYYAIYAYDKKPNFSQPAMVFATPLASISSTSIQTQTSQIPQASTQTNQTSDQTSYGGAAITGPFSLGMKSEQVKVLQQVLSQDKEVYPSRIITGYYGNLTFQAVKKFQEKYGLEQTGIAGPQTRVKIKEIYGGQISQTTQQITQQQSSKLSPDVIKAIQEKIKILQAKLVELLVKLAEVLKKEQEAKQ